MQYTKSDVLAFIEENDVKFIRLAFCDVLGNTRNISVMPSQIARVFEQGMPINAAAVMGDNSRREDTLTLTPNAQTLCVLPWRPQQGRVVRLYCDILDADGAPSAYDARALLRQAARELKRYAIVLDVGFNSEFYLFEVDENGKPTYRPHDEAGYLDIAPLDRGENIRREICLTLEQMGIVPECSHHEYGPGQNEIDLFPTQPLASADNLITYKSVVKTVAARNGLFASFLPKPSEELAGSALQVCLHVQCADARLAALFEQGAAACAAECGAYFNPLVNSYIRLKQGDYQRPYKRRGALLIGSPDHGANPYILLTLLIRAGIRAIENGGVPQGEAALPETLEQAMVLSQKSQLVRQALPELLQTDYMQLLADSCLDGGAQREAHFFLHV